MGRPSDHGCGTIYGRGAARASLGLGQFSGVLNLTAQEFAEARDRDVDSENVHDPPERRCSAVCRFLRIIFELLKGRD